MMELFLPRNFDDDTIVGFLNELEQHKDEEKIYTNYSNVEFVKPFATLLLAIGFRDFIHYRKSKGLKTISRGHKEVRSALTYLQHLGFFRYIGLNFGNEPNEAAGSSSYLPIIILTADQFHQEKKRLQVAIDEESLRLARIIYSGPDNDMRAIMLSYCLREIIRNVFEHAETGECVVVAQNWANGLAEIAIADRGIGLTQSLSEAYALNDSKDAISTAIKPGTSSDTDPENDDEWQNSGYGLYVVSQLGSMLGEFAIASDDTILFSKEESEAWYQVPISGTAVKLKVDTNEADYFPNVLSKIVTKGEELAKELSGAKKSASKKSKMATLEGAKIR